MSSTEFYCLGPRDINSNVIQLNDHTLFITQNFTIEKNNYLFQYILYMS